MIDQHAAWLAGAGVDFIWEDWSNNILYHHDPAKVNRTFDMIEGATDGAVRRVRDAAGRAGRPYAEHQHFRRRDRLAGGGDRRAAAAEGRPDLLPTTSPIRGSGRWCSDTWASRCLVIYVNTPSPFQNGTPNFHDDSIHRAVDDRVRHATAELADARFGQQVRLLVVGGPRAADVQRVQRHPEAMGGGCGDSKRGHGHPPPPAATTAKRFCASGSAVRKIGPTFAMVVSWNEWSRGEQPSAEVSKDIEPVEGVRHAIPGFV